MIYPKVKFVSLSATVPSNGDFAFYVTASDRHKLGGSTYHDGFVKITPASAQPGVKVKLDQWVNAQYYQGWGTAPSPNVGQDSEKSDQQNSGNDEIEVVGSDFPGIDDTNTDWHNIGSGTASVQANFNLYMEYQLQGETAWTTVGKVVWGIHGTMTATQSASGFTAHPSGSVTPGTGAESSEDPKAPADHN